MTKKRKVRATRGRTITNTDPEAQPSMSLAKRLVELTPLIQLLHDPIHAKRIDVEAKFSSEEDVLAVLD